MTAIELSRFSSVRHLATLFERTHLVRRRREHDGSHRDLIVGATRTNRQSLGLKF